MGKGAFAPPPWMTEEVAGRHCIIPLPFINTALVSHNPPKHFISSLKIQNRPLPSGKGEPPPTSHPLPLQKNPAGTHASDSVFYPLTLCALQIVFMITIFMRRVGCMSLKGVISAAKVLGVQMSLNAVVRELQICLLPARRRPQGLVVIGVCLSVCAHFFCPQDISRTGSWITTKFGGWEQGVNL